MPKAFITITNSDVNSGTSIKLFGAEFTISLKKLTKTSPLVGQTVYTLPVGDNLGIDVPVFTVRGAMDVDQFTNDSTLWNSTAQTISGISNCVTLKNFYDLWRSKSDTYLNILFGNPNNQKYWRNYSGSGTAIYVLFNGISFTPDTGSEGCHLVNYSMDFVEVI